MPSIYVIQDCSCKAHSRLLPMTYLKKEWNGRTRISSVLWIPGSVYSSFTISHSSPERGAVGWDQEPSKQQRGWGGCSQTCLTETKAQRRKRRHSCGNQLQHGSVASQRQIPRAKQWVHDAYRWLVGFVMFWASADGLEGSGKCEIPGSSDTGILLSSRNLFEDSSPWKGRLLGQKCSYCLGQ